MLGGPNHEQGNADHLISGSVRQLCRWKVLFWQWCCELFEVWRFVPMGRDDALRWHVCRARVIALPVGISRQITIGLCCLTSIMETDLPESPFRIRSSRGSGPWPVESSIWTRLGVLPTLPSCSGRPRHGDPPKPFHMDWIFTISLSPSILPHGQMPSRSGVWKIEIFAIIQN